MAVPKSRMPSQAGSNGQQQIAVPAGVDKDKLQKAIEKTKVELAEVSSDVTKARKSSLGALRNIGSRVNKLAEPLTKQGKAQLRKVFIASAGCTKGRISIACSYAELITDDQHKELVKKGVTTAVARALVAIKDKKNRDTAYDGIIKHNWDERNIRTLAGTNNKRRPANKQRTLDKSRKKPPEKVFMKCDDDTISLIDGVASAGEAVARMTEATDKTVQRNNAKALKKLRNDLTKFVKDASSFLKLTEKM